VVKRREEHYLSDNQENESLEEQEKTMLKKLNEEAPDPKLRYFNSWFSKGVTFLAFLYAAFHVYTAVMPLPNLMQRSIHVGLGLVLAFLLYKTYQKKKDNRVPILDWIAILIAIVSALYIVFNYMDIMRNPSSSTPLALTLGFLLMFVILEGARRVMGIIFPVIAVVMLGYAFLGPYLPTFLAHRGVTFTQMIQQLYLSPLGYYGQVTGIIASVVGVFIVFGSILIVTGGGRTFMDIALLVAGRRTGGPAKVAVVSSSMFGLINGSAAANVAVTGNFSIPMMKKLGYKPSLAGAVEATASTGGQLVPPIMGAAAFVMAEIINTPYSEIVKAAIIPAMLFYLGVIMSVHFYSKKRDIKGLENESQIKSTREVLQLNKILHLFVPIVVFIYFIIRGYTPQSAGFWAIIVAVVLFLVFDQQPITERLQKLYKGFVNGGIGIILMAALGSTAQIIVSVLGQTGLGVRFSSMIANINDVHLIFGLIVAMVITIILGMGVPTVAAYVIAASVIGPPLVSAGLEPLTSHLFLFYFALISGITPPVCTSVYVAASVAKANWFRTSLWAMVIGLSGFIIPYMFIYGEGLLLKGSFLSIFTTVLTAVIGIVTLSAATMGYLIRENKVYETLILLIGSLLLIVPHILSSLVGLFLISAVLMMQFIKNKKNILGEEVKTIKSESSSG
jgi:TRAP transporter 4TM/12TM fusion protein